jgi:hypothetical protein
MRNKKGGRRNWVRDERNVKEVIMRWKISFYAVGGRRRGLRLISGGVE